MGLECGQDWTFHFWTLRGPDGTEGKHHGVSRGISANTEHPSDTAFGMEASMDYWIASRRRAASPAGQGAGGRSAASLSPPHVRSPTYCGSRNDSNSTPEQAQPVTTPFLTRLKRDLR